MAASKTLASLPHTAPPRYTVSLARDERDVRAAQRLRHKVFAGGLGASLTTPEPGLDVDAFDDCCDHLLVREEATGAVVGTYRLLRPVPASAAGSLYAAAEFQLGGLAGIRHDLVEASRFCVHPDHNEEAVVSFIWAGVARYLTRAGHGWLGGCCSVPLADGGALAGRVWETLSAKHLSPAEYRVTPRLPWRATATSSARAPLPPLLSGYVRLGAWVCGEPAYDVDFGAADFYVLLSVRHADPRHFNRLLALASAW
ncbi:GNAT family N-acetyltransferase [Streptomyces sp. NBC_00878]|uniref:GNAT family N-acetyltransferase n=1 Tax=Streptomyces sp. NBC_00878 TaxID=2975854 RepID=UPI0022564CB9|nr:GNAT family N-acyltransferase [Streptomyces sp. NBC_00878]MCX4904387.1 GNAT family N-acetyltransferase [Streptomyces sp. NBC_00878]